MLRPHLVFISASLCFIAACGQDPGLASDQGGTLTVTEVDLSADDDPELGPDLPLGVVESELRTNWGSALDCKPIPDLPELPNPRIIISIDGLTLHLIDESVGYDRVFPIGVGAQDDDERSSTYGESLSYFPNLRNKTTEFSLKRSGNVACKTWWTDPDTGEKSPVFAGLPFMRWYGAYAIHGPIDNFTAPNGGNLTRGYVSHGCARMEAADVLEVYARVGKRDNTPVRVQREAERASDGRRIDTRTWVGSECASDLDCAYEGGFCHGNAIGQRGFCSKRCDKFCDDRAGSPATFCVADPDDTSKGMCVAKVSPRVQACKPFDHLRPTVSKRFNQPSVSATVCLPGSRGWVGDRCLSGSDCQAGNVCNEGLCAQPCSRFCPDQVGAPWTFCSADTTLGSAGVCERVCTPATNASECAAGTTCGLSARANDAATQKFVCR